MREIMISIALVALMLTGCSQKEARTTAVENVATNTIATVGDADTATTEAVVENKEKPAPEKETLEANNAVTTEIGGGKKKAEETTEEKKPSTTESTKPSTNHSNNSGSTSSGQSTTPKPSNSGSNSGNSGSGNSGNSGNSSSNNGGSTTPATTEAPTTQHQHNYNVWVKTKDAWDEEVIDQAAYDEIIEHPAEYKTVPAVQCNGCHEVFLSMEALAAHPCGGRAYGETTAKQMTHDAWTETIPAKTHTVHHDEEGYWACSCGARK